MRAANINMIPAAIAPHAATRYGLLSFARNDGAGGGTGAVGWVAGSGVSFMILKKI